MPFIICIDCAMILLMITNEWKMIQLVQNGYVQFNSLAKFVGSITMIIFNQINLTITLCCFSCFTHLQLLTAL